MISISLDVLLKNQIVESTRIEYKKEFIPNKVLHTICAFANDIDNIGGGYILIGIDENNGMPNIPFTGIEKKNIDKIKQKIIEICNYIEPRFIPEIEDREYDGKNVIVIAVRGSNFRPHKATKDISKDISNKRFYIRKSSSTIEANSEEEKELFNISNSIPFDDRECLIADINDIDIVLVREHLQEINSDKLDEINKFDKLELLEDMNLISKPRECAKPLNVSILMFSENPQKFFKHAYIEVVDIPDPTGKNITERYFKGPIQRQLRDALQYLRNYVIESKTIKEKGEFEAKVIYNYPMEAIDEILSNAVYHKSYQDDVPITVRINFDSIEFISVPGFSRNITNDDIKNKKIRGVINRNRRIGDFLKELKLIEGRNTGFPNIYKSLENNGSDSIDIEMDEQRTYISVKIKKHNDFITKKNNKLLDENLIISFLSKKSMSKVELAKALGYKGITKKLTDTIKVMEEKRILTQQYGNGRETKLILCQKPIANDVIISVLEDNRSIIAKVDEFLKQPIPDNIEKIQHYIAEVGKMIDVVDKKCNKQIIYNENRKPGDGVIINLFSNEEIIIDSLYLELLKKLQNQMRNAFEKLGNEYKKMHEKNH